MTLEEFWVLLSEDTREWKIENGMIRSRDGFCPVCAVADNQGVNKGTLAIIEAGNALGLTPADAYWIASGADSLTKVGTNASFRSKLREILKL